MNSLPESYREVEGVDSVNFDGYVETSEHYEGTIEADLDETVLQIWFRDVPLSDIAGEMVFNVEEVYGVRPEEEIPVTGESKSEILEKGMFSGVGLESESGPTVYVEHPTRYTTGLGETSAHQHVEYLLNGRVEFDANQNESDVRDAVEFGNELLQRIGEVEEEREKELWQEWAEETGYREKGWLGRLWLRVKSTGPDGLGPKNINPYSCIDDLDRSGLPAEELIETAGEF